MRVIRSPHCRVHGLGQSLCCRASPRWAQGGEQGMEGQEQPLWSYCGRENLGIFWTSLQLFLRKWKTMEKAQMSQTQLILEGKNPHELEWELYISATPACEKVKLWYSSRQQTFLLSSFAFKMTIWYIIKRQQYYWGRLCCFLCQVFREGRHILGCYLFQIK